MRRFWSEIPLVFGEEVRRATGRTAYRITTLAVPVILLIALIAVPVIRGLTSNAEADEDSASRIGIVNLSEQHISEAAQEAGIQLFPQREEGMSALTADDIDTLFIIPKEYLESGRVEALYRGSIVSAGLSTRDAKRCVQELLREALVGDILPPEKVSRFLWPASFDSTLTEEGGTVKEGVQAFSIISVSYIFGVLLLISVATGSGYLLQSVSEEKENRMVEVLLTSISPLGLMSGKVLALGLVSLIQLVVWAISIALFGPRILEGFPQLNQIEIEPLFLLALIAFFLAGYFVLAVTVAGVGAATTSYQEASQMSVVVYLLAAMPLILIMFIAGNPDGEVAKVLSFIPFTAPAAMVLRMGATTVALVEIVVSLIVTLLGGVLLLWGSARIFRAGLLMYGQRMSLRRVVAALREAG
jgi:ABC-2 type transport system permease protein